MIEMQEARSRGAESPPTNSDASDEGDSSTPSGDNAVAPERTTAQDALLMQQFWRTYDTIVILSISAVLGIMFRMMSATWFRSELGVVFSEDSALGTNLPLNIWSCFLMGLLCSGRDALGIVNSKVLGGANPYGTGRGILEVGRNAYRYDVCWLMLNSCSYYERSRTHPMLILKRGN